MPVDRRPITRSALGAFLAAVTLCVSALVLPTTEGAFTAVSDNTANSLLADTLDPPTSLIVTSGVTNTLNWTATIDAYADGYRVLRSATPGGPYTQIADLAGQGTVSHVDAPAEGRYYYVIRSYAGTWESIDGNEATGRAWRAFDCPADPALRACIRFDSDLGGTYADGSAYGNTVVHSNSAQIEGISDMAADGSPLARYEMADSVSLDLTSAMTLETWVRFDSVPTTGRAGLIDNDGQYALIYLATTGGLRCSNSLANLPTVAVPVGVWFHVACTWDGATLTMYYDGMPVATMASTGTMATTNTNPVSLLDTSPVFDEPLDGAMDNVRIWHVRRTQAQICADAGLSGC